MAPPQADARWWWGGVSATTLAAKLSLFLPIKHRTGDGFSRLPSGGMRDKVFLPPKSFFKLKSPTAFVPIYTSFPYQK